MVKGPHLDQNKIVFFINLGIYDQNYVLKCGPKYGPVAI